MRPRTRANGWMKCRYATVARYQSRLPGSESTSDRSAYAMFLTIVAAMPTRPTPRSSEAAQLCWSVPATARPAITVTNEITCHLME